APAAAPSRPTTPARAAPTEPTGAGQFGTEAQARAHCPGDTVVWANLDSRIFHFSGNRSYGATKKGAYMCEREWTGQGFRAAKNERHPWARGGEPTSDPALTILGLCDGGALRATLR